MARLAARGGWRYRRGLTGGCVGGPVSDDTDSEARTKWSLDALYALSRALTTPGSRRAALGALFGVLLGSALSERSRDALAAAGKENKNGPRKTRHGHASPQHDQHPQHRSTSKNRHPPHGTDRHQAPTDDLPGKPLVSPTDEPTPEPVDAARPQESDKGDSAAPPDSRAVSA